MGNNNKRVVISGMGIWSCIGKDLDEVRCSLHEGRSGIGTDPVRKEFGYRSALTGIVAYGAIYLGPSAARP